MPIIKLYLIFLTLFLYNNKILKVLLYNTTNLDCYNLQKKHYKYNIKLSSTRILNYAVCDNNLTSIGTCIL